MNKILSKRFFSDNVAELVVEAPLIARSRRKVDEIKGND